MDLAVDRHLSSTKPAPESAVRLLIAAQAALLAGAAIFTAWAGWGVFFPPDECCRHEFPGLAFVLPWLQFTLAAVAWVPLWFGWRAGRGLYTCSVASVLVAGLVEQRYPHMATVKTVTEVWTLLAGSTLALIWLPEWRQRDARTTRGSVGYLAAAGFIFAILSWLQVMMLGGGVISPSLRACGVAMLLPAMALVLGSLLSYRPSDQQSEMPKPSWATVAIAGLSTLSLLAIFGCWAVGE